MQCTHKTNEMLDITYRIHDTEHKHDATDMINWFMYTSAKHQWNKHCTMLSSETNLKCDMRQGACMPDYRTSALPDKCTILQTSYVARVEEFGCRTTTRRRASACAYITTMIRQSYGALSVDAGQPHVGTRMATDKNLRSIRCSALCLDAGQSHVGAH